jgi:hypothetical protein
MDQAGRELVFRKRLRLWFRPFLSGCLLFVLAVFALMVPEWGERGRLRDTGPLFGPWCLLIVAMFQNKWTLRMAKSFAETRLAFGVQWVVCSVALFVLSRWIEPGDSLSQWLGRIARTYQKQLGSLLKSDSFSDFGFAVASIIVLLVIHLWGPFCWVIASIGLIQSWRESLRRNLNRS